MRVEESIVVNAPCEAVWDHITDPARYPEFFHGITRWDVEGRRRRGLGARYTIRMAVGAAEIGGLIEVVEFDPPGDMAWTSVLGLDHRGRWRLRARGPNRTLVALRLTYYSPGGVTGAVADRVAAPIVSRNVRIALEQLKRHVEARRAAESQPRRTRRRTVATA